MALGAQQESVLRLVVGNGIRLTLFGVVLGAAGALLLTRLMKGFLFQVTPTDPETFAVIVFFLVLVGFLASYIPARRAMRVDPVVALRYEVRGESSAALATRKGVQKDALEINRFTKGDLLRRISWVAGAARHAFA